MKINQFISSSRGKKAVITFKKKRERERKKIFYIIVNLFQQLGNCILKNGIIK
jgi:hypothetical protein